MRSNCHLTALDLSWNPIGEEGLSGLMAALQHNGTVTELGIENIQVCHVCCALGPPHLP